MSVYVGTPAVGVVDAEDPDGDLLSLQVVTPPRFGQVTLRDDGAFVFLADAGWTGVDRFAFRASDGAFDAMAWVHVLVAAKPDDLPTGKAVVSGLLTYDDVPTACDAQGCRLAYAATRARPIRGAVVQLLSAVTPDAPPVAETVSDSEGSYQLVARSGATVQLLVLSETRDPPVTVEDNTRDDAVFALASPDFVVGAAVTQNVHAESGWSQGAYAAPRSAAPFSLLDVAYGAGAAMSAVGALRLPLLRLNWSERNRPERGDPQLGRIGTSHWDEHEMYILGAAGIDTDEYDDHVLAHEWSHYFETTMSRCDSIGGSHGFGDLMEPRVAFSEGWANAAAAMLLYPSSRYVDTYGFQQGHGFYFDVEDNDLDDTPGWFSEASVQAIVFDLFDTEQDGVWDTAALGIAPIVDALLTRQRTTPALTTVFSFIDALKQANPDAIEQIDSVVSRHAIDPIVDPYGSGETNDAGLGWALPVYHEAEVDGNEVVLTLVGSPWYGQRNKLAGNRYVRFRGIDGTVALRLHAEGAVAMYLYHAGRVVTDVSLGCWAGECDREVEVALTDVDYVLVVQGLDDRAEEYSCVVAIRRV